VIQAAIAAGHPKQIKSRYFNRLKKYPTLRLRTEGSGLPPTFSLKTLGFCAVRVGSLVENSETRTTFLLRYLRS
jgi:hypothetical protein